MSKNGVYPCFICRQALVDYCDMNIKIIIYNLDGLVNELKLEDLCSHTFSKGDFR